MNAASALSEPCQNETIKLESVMANGKIEVMQIRVIILNFVSTMSEQTGFHIDTAGLRSVETNMHNPDRPATQATVESGFFSRRTMR